MKEFLFVTALFLSVNLLAQPIQVGIDLSTTYQEIDGFGAHQGNAETNQAWWQELYYDDLGASMYRVDLTPRLKSPYSDLSYYSPWFMGSQTNSVFNLEDPDNPDGPEGNRVRTYTGPEDYSREFGGLHAPIAVMGPDIEENVKLFTFPNDGAIQAGIDRKEQLGDFKLIGSLWSPVPWVKISSGNTWSQGWWPGPVFGSPWPFIWGGNFAGGMLDVSGQVYDEFDDSALGGTGPTSALTQFARSTAAYVLGYQRAYNTTFYAISIQNELNFEQFYNSATYPLSSQYITALKAIRAEFDKYPELAGIRLMGPEDLLGRDAYGMYEYGGPVHKNLQYLKHLSDDPEAMAALDLFCIHGYGSDGVTSAGAESQLWDWWVNGWTNSPAPGIPGNVEGFLAFGKKSWMTETSGEDHRWLWPATGYPSNGGWSVALKIHQALTTGMESAWLYWTFTEADSNGEVTPYTLTSQAAGNLSPKFVAAKHFFKFIPPGSVRVKVNNEPNYDPLISAYYHAPSGRLTIVAIQTGAQNDVPYDLSIPLITSVESFETYTSTDGNYWVESSTDVNPFGNIMSLQLPGYSVTTLTAIVGLTDLEEPQADPTMLRCYPNPGSGVFQVVVPMGYGGLVSGRLLDLTGREIWTGQQWCEPGTTSVRIGREGLPSGVYLVELALNGRRSYSRVTVGD